MQVIGMGRVSTAGVHISIPKMAVCPKLNRPIQTHWCATLDGKETFRKLILHAASEGGYPDVSGVYTGWNLSLEMRKWIFPYPSLKTKSVFSLLRQQQSTTYFCCDTTILRQKAARAHQSLQRKAAPYHLPASASSPYGTALSKSGDITQKGCTTW